MSSFRRALRGRIGRQALTRFEQPMRVVEAPLRGLAAVAGQLRSGRWRSARDEGLRAVGLGTPQAVHGQAALLHVEGLLDALGVQRSTPVEATGPLAEAMLAVPQTERAVRRSGDVPFEGVLVLAGALGVASAARRRALVSGLPAGTLVVVVEPVPGPTGAGPVGVRPRRLERWRDFAQAHELIVLGESRADDAGLAALALSTTPSARSLPAPTRVSVRREAFHVHVRDDLSLSTSFAWIMGRIALTLADLGTPVTIEPTAVASTFTPEDRGRLMALVGDSPLGDRAGGEVGWTHYWPEYERKLLEGRSLALFAINHTYAVDDKRPLDPWLDELVAGQQHIGAISTFCADVLADLGVAAFRLHQVPLGPTADSPAEGILLPGGRGLKLLHQTNSSDLTRHGTATVVDAYQATFGPEADSTLVLRDYGPRDGALAARVATMREQGYDIRYWPLFLDAHRLSAALGAFDVLLAPNRGEGFGIKILDAMLAGVVPVAPLFGGPADYLDASNALLLDHDLEPMTTGYDAQHQASARQPLWSRSDVGSTAAALAALMSERDALPDRSRAARETARAFTWQRSAIAVLDALTVIALPSTTPR